MKICIHRGSKEIGGSCVELAYQGNRILLDYGLPLETEVAEINLIYIHPINWDSVLGVVISHPHQDHYGLLPRVPDGIPVLMGKAARNIILAAFPFMPKGEVPRLAGANLENVKTLELGDFRITPYLVDHSAFDACSLLLEAGGKRVFYSGDFRAHGRKAVFFDNLLKRPPSNVDVLLMEGSSLARIEEDTVFPSVRRY